MKYNRREFFGKTFKGAAIIAIPGILSTVLESCNKNANPLNPSDISNLPTINTSSNNGTISLNINSSSPLKNTGSAALVRFQSGAILVSHPSGNSFNALSSICTHQGCTITEYDSNKQDFVCPCHGSVYNSSGKVVSGPAGSPLPTYQSNYNGGVLNVKV